MIGLYIEVYEPPQKGGAYIKSVNAFSSYSHNINAVGGFWDASITVETYHADAEDWYEHGLGRKIVVKNQWGFVVWSGFVNQITIGVSSQTITRGPIMEIVNRAGAIYTPRDFSVYPPTDGTQTITLLAEDIISQDEYGIFEQWVAAGTTTESIANQVRNVFLEQNRLPKTTGDLSISGEANPVSLTLECLGKVHWLRVYPYNNFTPLVETIYDKLIQILTANPNAGWLSTNYNYIDDNLFAVDQLENKNRYAWDIINELLAIGNDTNDLRRIFGVYENDFIFYKTIPTEIEYEYKLSSKIQRVIDIKNQMPVHPWDIRPGRWIRVSDWLIGRPVNSVDLKSDPRNKFIENVNFSMPYTVGISGSPFDNLSQMLAKITYTGGIY